MRRAQPRLILCQKDASEPVSQPARLLPLAAVLRGSARYLTDITTSSTYLRRLRRETDHAKRGVKMETLPKPESLRQMIKDCGASLAAVYYLEALVSAVLDAGVGTVSAETSGKVLLAEELLLILTGSDDVEQVRTWMSARELEPYCPGAADSEAAQAPA